jgi:phage tail tape-measure protein
MGSLVGAGVGSTVGSLVGANVGSLVGANVGSLEGSGVPVCADAAGAHAKSERAIVTRSVDVPDARPQRRRWSGLRTQPP